MATVKPNKNPEHGQDTAVARQFCGDVEMDAITYAGHVNFLIRRPRNRLMLIPSPATAVTNRAALDVNLKAGIYQRSPTGHIFGVLGTYARRQTDKKFLKFRIDSEKAECKNGQK